MKESRTTVVKGVDGRPDMDVEESGGEKVDDAIEEVVETSMEVDKVRGPAESIVVEGVVDANMEMDGVEKEAMGAAEGGVTDGNSVPEHKCAKTPVEESSFAREEHAIDSQGLESQAAIGNAVRSTTGNGDKANLSIAELVAKGRAPVKSEFLATAGVRIMIPNGSVTGSASANGVGDENKDSRFVPEKKSKRQMKRERLLAKKSTEGICAIVARTGDVKQCPYAANCRFNHDLEGYLAQKPPDLPGRCPSLDTEEPCSYGIACRFATTHKKRDTHEGCQERRSNTASNELNSLSKELQKLLWKNMGLYPKADAQLRAMGLMNKAFKMRKVAGEDNQMHEPGLAEKEEAPDRYVGVRVDASETTTQSAFETVSSAPVNSKYVKQPEIEETAGYKCNIGDVAEHLKEGPAESDCPVLSRTTDGCSPPQKRQKSEAGERMGNSPVNDRSSDNYERFLDISTKLDEEKNNALDGPAGDIQAQVGVGKLNPSRDSWRSLYVESKLGNREKKIIDFREKLYLAPLTTVGNLPFRRVCKGLGADITCGEMAMCTNLLQGQASEWALLRRHSCEDLFGVQICGSFPDHVARTAELIEQECAVDFIDINMGCPIDLVVNKGSGSCLLTKPQRLEQIVRVTAAVMEIPLTVKLRMGYFEGRNCAHTLMPNLSVWGVSAVTVHGRTRQQRYSKQADWAYVHQCAAAAKGDLQVIGNGDVFSYTDWTEHLETAGSKLSTCMIARGALIKPWLFREIKERRHWDISSSERLDILRQYVHCGLAHWGSDSKGVETTRHFLLEWLSYMHRYIPVGLLEVVPQKPNWRPPSYFGRNDLETMMASESAADWVRITEILLGPTPTNFAFNPKHKSNAYDKPENG